MKPKEPEIKLTGCSDFMWFASFLHILNILGKYIFSKLIAITCIMRNNHLCICLQGSFTSACPFLLHSMEGAQLISGQRSSWSCLGDFLLMIPVVFSSPTITCYKTNWNINNACERNQHVTLIICNGNPRNFIITIHVMTLLLLKHKHDLKDDFNYSNQKKYKSIHVN